MMNRKKIIVGLVSFLSIIAVSTPIVFYIKDFGNLPRSANTSDWGAFGDFFGGILNPIFSLLTLIVTIVIALYLNRIERRNHDETVNSPVKPLFVIVTSDFFSSNISRLHPTIDQDYYDYSPPNTYTEPYDYFEKQFYLKVANKGLGLAHKINVIVEIDLNALKGLLSIDDPKIKIESSEITKDDEGLNFMVLIINSKYFNYHGSYKIRASEIGGMGVIDKGENVKVFIPKQIMDSFQIFNAIRKLTNIEITFPAFFVTFNYCNIHNQFLTSKFKIRFFHIYDYQNYSRFEILQEQVI